MIQLLLLLALILLGTGYSIIKRTSVWRQGKRPTATLPPSLLLTVPKRYFVDLHHVVMRDMPMAYTHILVAGGTVALLLLALIALTRSEFTQWLALVLLTAVTLGSIGLLLRRRRNPSRLSYGAFSLMPFSLLAFGLGLSGLIWYSSYTNLHDQAAIAAWGCLALALLGGLDIFCSGALERPFKHIIAGCAHLAFHPRQERFYGKRSSALQPNSTTQEQSQHGVACGADFSWQQIIGFDSCIQCGRCQEACPAFAAGQPLNPKKLIQDLLVTAHGGSDACYSGANHPGLETGRSIADSQASICPEFIDNATLFACTTCRACVEACPMLIEHVDAIVDLRRHQTLDLGAIPGKGQEVLANLRYSDTLSGASVTNRGDWAVDLELPYASTDCNYDLLLLCGEGGFDLRHQQALRRLVMLLQTSSLSIALLANEPDCGDTARRLGDEVGFIRLAQKLDAQLRELQFTRLLTCDPHLYHAFNREYPTLGINYPIVHHSELLLELIEHHGMEINPINQRLTYHDPCYLGRYNGVFDAPRRLLNAIGAEVIEMQASASNSRCCGWGGGAAFTDVQGQQRIPDMRMDDVRATACDTVATSCPNCMTMLEGVVEPRPQVLDLVELVYQAHQAAQAARSNQGSQE